jgi:hypothetical protein
MSDIYDYEYDDRTWNEKYASDNTWQRDEGLVELDGRPYYMWCPDCSKPVRVREIRGSNVFDRYSYYLCAECGGHHLRQVTEKEADKYKIDGDIG